MKQVDEMMEGGGEEGGGGWGGDGFKRKSFIFCIIFTKKVIYESC